MPMYKILEAEDSTMPRVAILAAEQSGGVGGKNRKIWPRLVRRTNEQKPERGRDITTSLGNAVAIITTSLESKPDALCNTPSLFRAVSSLLGVRVTGSCGQTSTIT